jgi:small subunit ribosomal protein S9
MAEEVKKKKKSMFVIGKRKKSIARAIITEGTGKITINSRPIDTVAPRFIKMRLMEPIVIAGEKAKNVDIRINVNGGGVWGQANASRTAIANALVKWGKDTKLQEAFVDYDRSLMVSDPRRTEPHKPSRSTAGPRRSKQQSKR